MGAPARNGLVLAAIVAAAVGGIALVVLLDRPSGDDTILAPDAPEARSPSAPPPGESGAPQEDPAARAPGPAETPAPESPGPGPAAPEAAKAPESALPTAGPGEIAGRTVDERTRRPIAASVSVEDADGNALAKAASEASGDFRIGGLAAGSGLVLAAGAAGYAPLRMKDLALAEGKGLSLGEIALAPVPLLRGTVADDKGRMIAGAAVALTGDTGMKFGPDLDLGDLFKTIAHPDATAARTTTGPDGAFAFYPGDAPDGEYCLRAAAPGFATALVHGAEVRAGKEGQSHAVVLEKPAVLAGKVADPLKGGVEGAFITALGEPDPQSMMEGRFYFDKRWTESGPEGRFRFEDLPQGRYTLIVRKEGYANSVAERVETPAEDVAITLKAGFILRGRVVEDATGKAVAGAKVLAVGEGGEGEGSGFGQTQSDAEGNFEIRDLSPGEYEVMVSAPGFTSAKISVDGSAGGALVREARLKKGIRVSGKVLEEGTRKPLPGAKVTVFPFGDDFPMGGTVPKTESGPDGSFVLEGVRVSEKGARDPMSGARSDRPSVLLMVSLPGWFAEGPIPVEASGGGDTSGVEVLLKPSCAVSGRVVDAEGRPVQGATVSPVGQGEMDFFNRLSGIEQASDARTDPEGKFRLHLRPGAAARLLVRHPAFAFEVAELPEVPQGKPVENLTVRLGPGGTIEGTARNERGEPAGGMAVEYRYLADPQGRSLDMERSSWMEEKAPQVPTGADGSFRIEHLRAGDWGLTLKSGKADAAPLEKVRVVEGKVTRAELRIANRVSIHGIVVDDAGSALEGAQVSLWRDGRDSAGNARTRADGTFQFDGLLPGTYGATAWRAGHRSALQKEIQAGSAGVRLVLERVLTIRGVVVHENGVPAPEAGVEVKRLGPGRAEPEEDVEPDTFQNELWIVGRDGSFEIKDLSPGDYELTAWIGKGDDRRGFKATAKAGTTGVRLVVP